MAKKVDSNIGSLPKTTYLADDSLLVAEQQGEAVAVPGSVFIGFAQDAVAPQVSAAQSAAKASKSSATDAKASEEKAAESETNAGSSASAAEEAKLNAEESEWNAAQSRRAAETAAQNAAKSETAAGKSATAAAGSATAASNSATEAGNSATAASNYATAAENARDEAQEIANGIGVVQTTGDSETEVMSQGAVTREINQLSEDVSDLKKDGNIGGFVVVDAEEIQLPTVVTVGDAHLYKVDDADVQIFEFGNVFDKDSWIPYKRYDDSGNIVNDSSSGYVNTFVPADRSLRIYSNVDIQRTYLFDKNKNFIKRGYGISKNVIVNMTNNLTSETAYIMFQFAISEITPNLDTARIQLLSDGEKLDTAYSHFSVRESTDGTLFVGRNYIRSESTTTATMITYSAISVGNLYTGREMPLFEKLDVWQPETVDEGYSNATEGWGSLTNRSDWTAEDKYTYYEFLAHYYDCYLGISQDGYRVTKTSLGQDCGKSGRELFEYDFCPVNYKYTVMLSAGMNANETQGIWGLATFIRCLMNREEQNMSIARDNIRFKVIPIINASGFDRPSLQYNYVDGVNGNFNFNYRDSWSKHTSNEKGEYPDSNVATVMLKKWINDNSGRADLWLDLHTGRWNVEGGTNKKIMDIRIADSSMSSAFAPYVPLIKQFYIDKGYVTESDSVGGTSVIRNNLDYQKGVYAFDVCGIPSIMPEMHLESTGYGTDGYTNNAPNGIKAYVLQIRAMVMAYINAAAGKKYVLNTNKDERFHARYR